MDEVVRKMQEEGARSTDNVVLFHLIKNAGDLDSLIEKMGLLTAWGVSPEYHETIRAFLMSSYFCDVRDPRWKPGLIFFVRQSETDPWLRAGLLLTRTSLGQIAVQLHLAGIIASQTPGLIGEDGFETEYLPMGFYRSF